MQFYRVLGKSRAVSLLALVCSSMVSAPSFARIGGEIGAARESKAQQGRSIACGPGETYLRRPRGTGFTKGYCVAARCESGRVVDPRTGEVSCPGGATTSASPWGAPRPGAESGGSGGTGGTTLGTYEQPKTVESPAPAPGTCPAGEIYLNGSCKPENL